MESLVEFLKRKAFRHESEYRLVVFARRDRPSGKRLLIPVDPHRLILSVLMDPRAHEATVSVFKFFLEKRLKYHGLVGKSTLYDKPELE